MHIKRNKVSTLWPIERKGTKYIVRPLQSMKKGVPLVVAVRDMLKMGETSRDVKNILMLGKIKVDGKKVREIKYPIALYSILSLDSKNFKLVLKNKKLAFEEVSGKEAEHLVVKIIGKRLINGGHTQINLAGGRNYLIKESTKVGDSAVISLRENKVIKILSLKAGSNVSFIKGKHVGQHGKVDSVDENGQVVVSVNKEKINASPDSLMVVE